MEPAWKHPEVFPVIARIIEEAYRDKQRFVESHEIAARLLSDHEGRALIDAARDSDVGAQSPEWLASNMVSWFSQRISVGTSEWASQFERTREQPYAYKPSDPRLYPDQVPAGIALYEGGVCQVLVNAYERNATARRQCIEHYGANCSVCGFDFRAVFGEIGDGFIHVHHLRRLAEIRAEYQVDPIRDLRPVCPNCHAMLHRRDPPFAIEELKALRNPRAGWAAAFQDAAQDVNDQLDEAL
jgi:hypothetical protein